MKAICAVVVTFNRKELLIRNINSLKKQIRQLDILIFDNASTDGTKKYVLDTFGDDNSIIYIRSVQNLGGAGGFYYGSKEAYERGYKYMWLMDDDGYCQDENTLTEIMKVYERLKNKLIIVNSYVAKKENIDFSVTPTGVKRTIDWANTVEEKDDLYIGIGRTFNGTMVTSEIIDTIGFVKKEFFIYGDDVEYVARAWKHGIDIVTAKYSRYVHPDSDTNLHSNPRKFLWRTIYIHDHISPLRIYCRERNITWLLKTHLSKRTLLKSCIINPIKALYTRKNKWLAFKFTILGIKDGLTNNFNRKLPF